MLTLLICLIYLYPPFLTFCCLIHLSMLQQFPSPQQLIKTLCATLLFGDISTDRSHLLTGGRWMGCQKFGRVIHPQIWCGTRHQNWVETWLVCPWRKFSRPCHPYSHTGFHFKEYFLRAFSSFLLFFILATEVDSWTLGSVTNNVNSRSTY